MSQRKKSNKTLWDLEHFGAPEMEPEHPMPLTKTQLNQLVTDALASGTTQNPFELASLVAMHLCEARTNGSSYLDVISHPAMQVLVAQLAELSGLHYHYPMAALQFCRDQSLPSGQWEPRNERPEQSRGTSGTAEAA